MWTLKGNTLSTFAWELRKRPVKEEFHGQVELRWTQHDCLELKKKAESAERCRWIDGARTGHNGSS